MDQTLNSRSFLLCLTDGMVFQVSQLGHETVITRTTRKGEILTDTIQWAGETYQGTTGDSYRVATREDLDRCELAKKLVGSLVVETPSSEKFKGFTPQEQIPFRRGQNIVIPKGTTVQSAKGDKVTMRKQIVRVHHFGSGMSIHIGYCHNGVRQNCDLYVRHQEMDIRGKYGTSDTDVLIHHPDAAVSGIDIFLPMQPPTVIWPGTGGYWCEADINQLLEANEAA